MPFPLSDATRAAAVNAIVRGESTPSISTALSISERQVSRMKYNLKRYGTSKEPTEGKRRGPPLKTGPAVEERLLEHLQYNPGMHPAEMKLLVKEEFGIDVSATSIRRALKRKKVGGVSIAAVCSREDSDVIAEIINALCDLLTLDNLAESFLMASQYTSELPSIPIDPSIPKFFENFYHISDTPHAHDRYVNSFTDDATMILASKKAVGREEILSLRHGMWTAISSRSHSPTKIFPFGPNSTEVMIHGTVEFVFKEGGQASKDWAARAELVKADGGWKLGFYQVYLDTK